MNGVKVIKTPLQDTNHQIGSIDMGGEEGSILYREVAGNEAILTIGINEIYVLPNSGDALDRLTFTGEVFGRNYTSGSIAYIQLIWWTYPKQVGQHERTIGTGTYIERVLETNKK